MTSDTDRLDFMERHSAFVQVFDPPSGDAWVWCVGVTSDGKDEGCDVEGQGGTLREAIDHAHTQVRDLLARK